MQKQFSLISFFLFGGGFFEGEAAAEEVGVSGAYAGEEDFDGDDLYFGIVAVERRCVESGGGLDEHGFGEAGVMNWELQIKNYDWRKRMAKGAEPS